MMKKKFFSKKTAAFLISLAITAAGIIPLNIVNTDAAGEYNYAKALQYSMFFYDANMCGTGVDENGLLDWRGNCHVYDAKLPLDSQNTNMSDGFISSNRSVLDPDGDGKVDVSGGFHDAGDHVKFGLPEAYAASTVGWGYYEFREQFRATGQHAHAEIILRYFNDYFMRSTFRDASGNVVAFCHQVGDGDIDHAFWGAPENDTMFRRGWFITKEKPGTDIISGTAASLAINYMNFKDTDPQYAAKSLDYAKALFDFAEKNPKGVVSGADGPKGYYSSSKWEDDYCWAAAWLYLATQNEHYLDEVFKYFDYYAPPGWIHCWNDMWSGTACILAEIDDLYDKNSQNFEDRYKRASNKNPGEQIDFWRPIQQLLDKWLPGGGITITPGGYTFLNQWGSARYNTAAQLIALVYDKHHGDTPSKYGNWARSQMDYLLGKNPINRCYVVGYSSNSVKYPHHRAASGLSDANDPSPHKHVLYGALVGGPDSGDQHVDVTSDYIYNEVAIDYNAAFVGACAGLYRFFGDSSMQIDPSMPSPNVPVPTPSPTPTPVTEFVYGDLNGDGKVNSTDYTMMKRYLTKSISEFNTSPEAADLNRDGKINSTDFSILKRYLLQSIPSLPI